MNQKEVIQLINDYWKFDNDQDNLSTWHDKQDLISEIEKLNLSGVSHFADKEEPIIANITKTAFTTPSDHGIIEVELPYQYYKMKGWKEGDKIELKHCG